MADTAGTRLALEALRHHRLQVQAAAEADARYRPKDELVQVKVLQPFRVGPPACAVGRTAAMGEMVSVSRHLAVDLAARAMAELAPP